MTDFLLALFGILIGGVITALVSRHYYQRASKELRAEAAALRREAEDVRHYINALITYLEAAGAISVVRDENDRPIETTIIGLSRADLGARGLPATIKVDDPPEGEGNEAAPEGNEGG